MRKALSRKRPCRICRRWFTPHPRLKDRQKTCGNSHCQKQWHRKICRKWNRANADYFKSNYLQKKLDVATQCGKSSIIPQTESNFYVLPKSRVKSGLPLKYVQEV